MDTHENIKYLREKKGLSQETLAELVGYSDRSSIAKVEAGKVDLTQSKIAAFATALSVTPAQLMGLDSDDSTPYVENILPMPRMNRVPRLGRIACGEPILAEENIEDYDDVPDYIKCDFTLVCRGDSMINARIFDGDIVCIKKDVEIHSGDIAAVLVDGDEATLKRVRIFGDHIVLEAENPTFPRKDFWDEDMNRIQIIGKATHFISAVR